MSMPIDPKPPFSGSSAYPNPSAYPTPYPGTTPPTFGDSHYPPPNPPEQRKSGWTGCLIGCGIVFLVMLVVCVGSGVWIARNGKRILTDFTSDALVQTIQQVEGLEPQDKEIMIAEVRRVANAYKSGQITLEKMGKIMESLAESPLIVIGIVAAADKKYIQPSTLSDEEKAAARLAAQRVARGTFEKKIRQEQLEPVLDILSTKGPNDQRQFKPQLTDEELREFTRQATQLADGAQVSNEPFQLNIGEEFKRAVDRVLDPKPEAAPQ